MVTPCPLGHAVTVAAVARVVPQTALETALQATGTHAQRERALSFTTVLWVVIAMNRYTTVALGHVLRTLVQGLRFVWPDPDAPVPTASAFTYRRYQLGVRPVVALFRQVCRPIRCAAPSPPRPRRGLSAVACG